MIRTTLIKITMRLGPKISETYYAESSGTNSTQDNIEGNLVFPVIIYSDFSCTIRDRSWIHIDKYFSHTTKVKFRKGEKQDEKAVSET